MDSIRSVCLALAVALTTAGAVAAEDGPAASQAEGPAPAGRLRITPKAQYYIQSTNLRTSSTTAQSSSSQFEMPFYGATVDYRPARWRDTEISLTVLHGDGDFDTLEVSRSGTTNYNTDVSRTDAELLVRNHVPKTDFNWTYGLRWTHAPYSVTNRSGGIYSDSGTSRREVDHDYYSFLVGANIDTAMSSGGNHRVIGGVNLGVGYQHDRCGNCRTTSPADQEAVVLQPEMNFGYRYVLDGSNSGYIRYKFQGTMGEAGTYGGMFDEIEWGHGPEIGFSFTF